MKKTIVKAIAVFSIASLIVTSCGKKDDSAPDSSMSSEVSSVQTDFDDMHKVSQDAMNSNSQLRSDASYSCAASSTNGVDTITLDFGNSGCVGSDGRTRTGKLIISFTGKYRTTGSVIKISSVNYSVDGRKINGMRTVTNNGTNGSGNIEFTIVDSDVTGSGYASITHEDGTTGKWKSTRTREWSAGSSTPGYIFDDELIINGTAEGITSSGVSYSMSATDVKIECSCWLGFNFSPVSGVLTLTAPDGIRSLDYGSGDCDKKAMYTHTNGKTYFITLKR